REYLDQFVSWLRYRSLSLGNLLSNDGETSDHSRGRPSARRRDRRDFTASRKDGPMERLNSLSKSNPSDRSRCSGVAAKERRETARRGSAIDGRARFEIVAESPCACPRRDRHH